MFAHVIPSIARWLLRFSVIASALLTPISLLADAGDLDCGFGMAGTISHDLGSIESAFDAQLQSDGKIVTIGSVAGALRLSRFLEDGALDATFSSGGTMVHPFTGLGAANSLAVDSLDRIVVGGYINVPAGASSDQEVFVARFTSDGAVDTTFGGGDGWTSFDFTIETADAGTEGAAIVVVDSSDRPIVGGSADANGLIFNPSDSNMAVARLDTSGALDTTFDGDGISIASSAGAVDDILISMALDPLGRIVAIGANGIPSAARDTMLARWTTTGALDTTFDTDGVVILDLSESGIYDIGFDVGIDSTGAVIALAVTPTPTLARLTDAGALDTSFAGDGILQQSFLGGQDVTEHVRIQSDDKILVTGWPVVSNSFHFAVMRFTTAGVLDSTWSSPDGVATTAIGSNERAYAAVLRDDQKLLLLGGLDNDRDLVMARYLNDGQPNGPTTTTEILSDGPDPSLVAETVTVSYAVSATTGTPAGTVIVSDGTAASCTGTVAGGSCDLAWGIAPGERTVTATFVGGGGFCASSDTELHTVLVPTTTSFTFFTPDPSMVGQPVTVGVSVNPLNVGGVGPVTGSVTIDDGAGASCVGVLLAGSTSCQLTPTVAGTRTWTAAFPRGSEFEASFDTQGHQIGGSDFGDAPAPYPVTLADDGARHAFSNLFLGSAIDADVDGQPSPDALGDDIGATDDEDGIGFLGPIVSGSSVDLDVVASQSGVLDAWIDFGQDGSWLEAGDRIATAEPLVAGNNTLSVAIPAGATLGTTFGRFRISSLGVTGPTGAATDGEIEDHAVDLTDGIAPQVLAVADLVDAVIDDCATVSAAATGLRITFDEPVQGADQVDSYLVLAAGPDADLSTTSCAAAGDDIAQSIVNVSSDLDPTTPTFTLDLLSPLPTGLVRLVVCDAVEDLGGLAIDGDGDGLGGDPFVTTFRVDPGNLFRNGDFDRCPVSLTPWIEVATPPDTIQPSESEDADSSTLSGSAGIVSLTSDGSALAQCVALPSALSRLELALEARLDAVGAATATLDVACDFFDLAACAGAIITAGNATTPLPDFAGGWTRFLFSFEPLPTTLSALCEVAVTPDDPAEPGFDAYLDRLSLTGAPLFSDDFETGDLTAWSSD